jgi:hypothetical protein
MTIGEQGGGIVIRHTIDERKDVYDAPAFHSN